MYVTHSSHLGFIKYWLATGAIAAIFTLCNIRLMKSLKSHLQYTGCLNKNHNIFTKNTTNRFLLGCHNAHLINITSHSYGVPGVNKKAYYGLYDGVEVAVRMPTSDNSNNRICIEDTYTLSDNHQECSTFGNMKQMKDILLTQQMSHPNLIKLYGYCLRSDETNDKSIYSHGLIAFNEYAREIFGRTAIRSSSLIKEWTVEKRIRSVLGLADLMVYLQHSPLGYLGVPDLKPQHLMLVGDSIKMTDFDDSTTAPRRCSGRTCTDISNFFTLPCVDNVCIGFHEYTNNRRFGWSLFADIFPENVRHMLRRLSGLYKDYHENKLTPNKTIDYMQYLLQVTPKKILNRIPK